MDISHQFDQSASSACMRACATQRNVRGIMEAFDRELMLHKVERRFWDARLTSHGRNEAQRKQQSRFSDSVQTIVRDRIAEGWQRGHIDGSRMHNVHGYLDGNPIKSRICENCHCVVGQRNEGEYLRGPGYEAGMYGSSAEVIFVDRQ